MKSRVCSLFVAPDLLAWFFLCNWVWFFIGDKKKPSFLVDFLSSISQVKFNFSQLMCVDGILKMLACLRCFEFLFFIVWSFIACPWISPYFFDADFLRFITPSLGSYIPFCIKAVKHTIKKFSISDIKSTSVTKHLQNYITN